MDKAKYEQIFRGELAQRIYDLDIYEARDNDATPESIADDIKNYPLDVMGYLLDLIEDFRL